MMFISTQQNHSSPLCLTQVADADRWLLKREADSNFGCCWFFQISSASWENSSLRWWGWCWGGSQPTCRKAPAKLPVTKHRYQQHSLLKSQLPSHSQGGWRKRRLSTNVSEKALTAHLSLQFSWKPTGILSHNTHFIQNTVWGILLYWISQLKRWLGYIFIV